MSDDKYNPKEAEQKWLQYWESEKIYAFDAKKKGKIYSIDTPPPTVSGKMHIGHAFSYTQEDVIARYKRMCGFNVFYPFGTDDNGLPTERLVEKMKNVKGALMERQAFIKLCEETLKEIRPAFVDDWKRLGISCDFSLFYSTINEHCRRISQWSFIDLYHKGRTYRKEAPTLWCPECRTAIAQAELQDKEKQTELVHIEVKTEDGTPLIFATTRPELYPSCAGMSVHPTDSRYNEFVGKKVILPLTGVRIEVTTDNMVDPAFGTGVVYFCSSGDAQFLDWETRHPVKNKVYLINPDGTMNDRAGSYAGLTIVQARKKIVDDLRQLGVVKKIESLTHTVNAHERCGTVVEYLSSKQWFIKYLDLKNAFLELGNQLTWHPDFMRHRYENWVKGLKWDWCISRQRFFGVPFPVWYCKKCEKPVVANEKDLPLDPLKDKPPILTCTCGSTEFLPEKDVLDTWATSSLTPMIAAKLMEPTLSEKIFPITLRPQGHDIISTWLFYTTAKSYLHTGQPPWKNVAISGWVLDPYGKKMSKSKGNVIAPQEIINKYSADALRFAAATSKLGEDAAFQEKDLVAGDKFVTKVWNASKFAFMHLEGVDGSEKPTEVIDQWILSRLSAVIEESTEAFEAYEYSRARFVVERFFWDDLCDNYLELVKTRLYEPKAPELKKSAQAALQVVLPAVLKLMAPFTPFITEELYHKYLHTKEKLPSIHVSSWPTPQKRDKNAEAVGAVVVAILAAVRKKKSEMKLSMKAPAKKLVIESKVSIASALEDLKATCCAELVDFGKATEQITPDLKVSIEL
ncbi:valine--tRNA ligase [Candidatus Woesearchaeota archaeon]|nr:valine--tRNA ligase [Candidatus Woesearchaeota archaeon]